MCNGHEPVRDEGARPPVQDIEVGVLLSFSLILSPTLESPIPACDTESCSQCGDQRALNSGDTCMRKIHTEITIQ